MTAEVLYLAVDAGGTGCRARVEDENGTVLGQGLAGPASTRLGADTCFEAIMTASEAAMTEASLRSGDRATLQAGFGIAGFMARPIVRADLTARDYPFARCNFASDSVTACIGAHDGSHGAIVIVGTGSSGIAHLAAGDSQVGGYGFPLSDEGSGAFIGFMALGAATRALDRRTVETPLLGEILERFGRESRALVDWMDRANATHYATFAPAVVRHAMDGDETAREILQQAARGVEEIVRALLRMEPPRLSLIGGLASVLEAWLSPDLRRKLRPVLGDALDGAAILAGRPPRNVRETSGGGWTERVRNGSPRARSSGGGLNG